MTTDSALVAITGCVQGRVQGVGFRYSMQHTATGLGVTGWVRNLADSSVAFHAEGSQDAVAALLKWSQTGPPFARVEKVAEAVCEVCHFEAFEILP